MILLLMFVAEKVLLLLVISLTDKHVFDHRNVYFILPLDVSFRSEFPFTDMA